MVLGSTTNGTAPPNRHGFLGVSFRVLGLLLLCSFVGCGGPFDARVKGTVTLNGQPLDRGTVAFFPLAQGPPAHGRIDASGNYAVRVGREKGLPSGDYEVTVQATIPAEIPEGWMGPPPKGNPITPAKYHNRATSGLKYTVSRGSNEINIELSSDAA